MKAIVIYHSVYGSTRKIAHAIYEGMKKTGEPCDIARVKDIKPGDLSQYDLIGLGSPVMHRRELYNVTNFIQNSLKGVDGKHGFAFCTHGATPAYYLARVVPAMRQAGLIMIGWNDWFGDVYHPGCPKPYFTDGHPDEIDLKEAEEFGREMVERSKRIYAGEKDLIPVLPTGKEYDDMYEPGVQPPKEVYMKFKNIDSDLQFKVNRDKCKYPKCTLCMDNCTMNCIDFSTWPPVFHGYCDKCYGCVLGCPNGAIEVDWKDFHETHKPMVYYLKPYLAEFEKRGKFRRLVPDDKIGWDTFVWQKKNPVFKIDPKV